MAVDPVSHHIVTFGLAGNAGGTVQIFGAPGPLTPTSTALTSSLNPANFGQSVTFMATVTGADDITGTVEFFYGGTSLGSPVTLAAGMASLTTSTLPVGTDSITAIYSGDTYNAASYSPVLNETITGSASASTTALATSVNPVIVGHPVTFTATVTGSSPTGTIKFMDGGASLGSPVTLAAGVATLTTSTLAPGTHFITAVYSGDSANPTSTSGVLSEANLGPHNDDRDFVAQSSNRRPVCHLYCHCDRQQPDRQSPVPERRGEPRQFCDAIRRERDHDHIVFVRRHALDYGGLQRRQFQLRQHVRRSQ